MAALVIGAAALIAAACNGTDETDGGAPTPAAVAEAAAPAPAPADTPTSAPRPTDTAAPTAASTATPTPTTAPTPAPTPTAARGPTVTPTSTPPSLASFDPSRLAAVMAASAPMQLRVDFLGPVARSSIFLLAELDPLNEIWSQVLFFMFGDQSVVIESIGVGDVVYLRGAASAGGELAWMTATLRPGEEIQSGLPAVSDVLDLINRSYDIEDMEAVDLIPCGERVCFLVQVNKNPAAQLHVDAEKYHPVRIEAITDDGLLAFVGIEWGADVAIMIPEDPAPSTSESIGEALDTFLGTVFPPGVIESVSTPDCRAEPRSAADFDPQCLARVLSNMPAVRLRAEFPVLTTDGAFRLVAELPPDYHVGESELPSGNTPTMRQLLTFTVGAQSVKLELISADRIVEASQEREERQASRPAIVTTSVLSNLYLYVRGIKSDGSKLPWMAAPRFLDSLRVPDVEGVTRRLRDLGAAAETVALVDCGDSRLCFVIQPDPPDFLLYVDGETYQPVRWEIPSAEGDPLIVDVEWDADVEITLPENPVEAERADVTTACVAFLGGFEDAVGVADPEVGIWNGRHIASFCPFV